MITTKDNSGKQIGFVEMLVSNVRVVSINSTGEVTTVTTRDRASGQVKTETFSGLCRFSGDKGDSTRTQSSLYPLEILLVH
jgi:hypothetical protein